MPEEQKQTGTPIIFDFPVTKSESKSVSPKEENKQSLFEALIKESDQFAQESATKRRQRENEKIRFIGGVEISIKEIRDYMVANASPYDPLFPNKIPFFKEMYRLNDWLDRDPTEWIKPPQVPNYINEIIYGRFPKEILPSIQILNPFLPGLCIRGYKNFQFLNEDGQKLVVQYRNDCVRLMEESDTWHNFRIRYAKEYGVRYVWQDKLFDL